MLPLGYRFITPGGPWHADDAQRKQQETKWMRGTCFAWELGAVTFFFGTSHECAPRCPRCIRFVKAAVAAVAGSTTRRPPFPNQRIEQPHQHPFSLLLAFRSEHGTILLFRVLGMLVMYDVCMYWNNTTPPNFSMRDEHIAAPPPRSNVVRREWQQHANSAK